MILNTQRQAGRGGSVPILTRADVELLRSKVESSTRLDLSFQNVQHIDLSYMDLQGANLRGSDLQGAHLSDAVLEGANMSRAHLSDIEAKCVNLHQAKLSYATLRGLDLRGFDLTELDLRNVDLNGTDLRDALLHGADLRGADLSTAQLHGPELRGAKLYNDALFGDRLKQTHQGMTTRKRLASANPMLIQERSSPTQGHGVKQIKKTLSDREAYNLGEHALLAGFDPVKMRRLFPQGFTFVVARQLFDAWPMQSGDPYNEQ